MNRLPPTNHLAAAIKRLPRARPDVTPQVVEINAHQHSGRYRVTFIVRANPSPDVRAWFWGIEGADRIDVGVDHQVAAEVPAAN
jgi:hypothetical protein